MSSSLIFKGHPLTLLTQKRCLRYFSQQIENIRRYDHRTSPVGRRRAISPQAQSAAPGTHADENPTLLTREAPDHLSMSILNGADFHIFVGQTRIIN